MKMTQHSSPGFSISGFAAYGGMRPGQLNRMSRTSGSKTARSMQPCFCMCTPVHEVEEMASAAPCFCMCTLVQEAEEIASASPCFCLCTPAHEVDA